MTEYHTAPKEIKTIEWKQIKIGMAAGAGLAFFIVFAFWSGAPTGDRAVPFWTGVAILLILLAAFSWAAWYLLFKPLPAGQVVGVEPVRDTYRRSLALLLGVGQFAISVGAFWDEIWHRQYGVPFGEDFFWRPHLLIYFGIVVVIALAFTSLYILIRRSQGTIQQRFRANPVVGMLILAGGFLAYALPADPIWHEIYGEDLTAWGIPHLLLFLSFDLVLLLATAIYMTTQPRREWGSLRQLRMSDALPLWFFAAISLNWNQFFTTEWDGGARFGLARPEWLLPVLIASGTALIGALANHTLRFTGAATLSGVLALVMRLALIQLFAAENIMRVNAWVLALVSLVLVDLWYAYRRGAWAGAGVAAAVGMGAALVTVFDRFYPNNPITNLPLAFAMILAGSLGMSWLGAVLGDFFAEGSKQLEERTAGGRLPLVSLGLVAAFGAFIIFFVTTAVPPK